MPKPLARITGSVVLAGVLALGAAVPALADATPTPTTSSPTTRTTVDGNTVTITTDLATVQAWCARDHAAQSRLAKLEQRIQGDASTQGSVAWLRAKAAKATAAGHTEQARRLTERADRRQARLPRIDDSLARLRSADSSVCAALPGASS